MKIALCDDDMDDVELFQEAVNVILPGTELLVSNSCRQLHSTIRTALPMAIFLDINMPEVSGWECLKSLKSDAGLRDIPVVIYTTSSAKRDVEIAQDFGAFRLITKPDRFQDLLRILPQVVQEIKGEME